jgi:hypothetical protein
VFVFSDLARSVGYRSAATAELIVLGESPATTCGSRVASAT